MNIDIRRSIMENFREASENDIKESINDAIKDMDEVTLPGLGVFFELLWQHSSDTLKGEIIKTISSVL